MMVVDEAAKKSAAKKQTEKDPDFFTRIQLVIENAGFAGANGYYRLNAERYGDMGIKHPTAPYKYLQDGCTDDGYGGELWFSSNG